MPGRSPLFRFQDWSILLNVDAVRERIQVFWDLQVFSAERINREAAEGLTETCLLCHGDPGTSQVLWGNAAGAEELARLALGQGRNSNSGPWRGFP